MIKRLLTTTTLFLFFILTSYLLISGGAVSLVKAAQCWEPGCCGFTLVYYQYQCEATGASSALCRALDEDPYWFCPNTNQSWGNDLEGCTANCSESCQQSCYSGWASTCVIDHHNEPCTEGTNSCTASYAAIQCSSASGTNSCTEATGTSSSRSCYVNGVPEPSGDTPPDPGNCDGNWWKCVSSVACVPAANGEGVCGSCPSACAPVDKGIVAFTFFEDTNMNGVWDFNSGEARIQRDGSCLTTGNLKVVNGVRLFFENNELSPRCNIQNSEFEGDTCTWGPDECIRDGVRTGSCRPWGWENQSYGDKCFTEEKYCKRCHWDNQGCVDSGREIGMACGPDGVYCEGGLANMRYGNVYLQVSEVGYKDIDIVLPSGWVVSPGNYNGSTSFGVSVTNSYHRTRCEAGLKTIGIVPDYNKQCTVQLTDNSITTAQSTLAIVWGYSEAPASEPVRLILGKADYTEILDENNQPVIPDGAGHINWDGRHYYIFTTTPNIANGSFETGNLTNWIVSGGMQEAWAVDSQVWPTAGVTGRYYLKMVNKNDGSDAYVASDLVNTGASVASRNFTLSFDVQAHAGTQTINNILVQAGDGTWGNIGSVTATTTWTNVTRDITMSPSANSNSVRVVLRPPGNTVPVYFDNVILTSTGEVGGCTSGNSSACQQSTLISGLPVGDYKLHCDLPTAPQQCSGNPNCTYEGGTINCTANGWVSCSGQDNVNLEVTCSPQCGQFAGCPSTDLGNPTISNAQPTPTRNMTTYPGTVPITWTDTTTLSDYWTVIVYGGNQLNDSQRNTIADACATYTGTGDTLCGQVTFASFDANHDGILDSTPTFTYDPEVLKDNSLRVAVRATNDSCTPFTGSDQNSGWIDVPLNLVANVTGTLYEGDGNPSGSVCTGPTGTTAGFSAAAATRRLAAASGGIDDTALSHLFTIQNVPYIPTIAWGSGTNITMSLTNADMTQALACECPSAFNQGDPFTCRYGNVLTPSSGTPQNFWLQEYNLVNGPWWQTWGGTVYAASGNIVSDIPQVCIDDSTGYCRSYMVAQDADLTADSAGVPMSGSGAYSSGDTQGYVTDRDLQQVAVGTYHDNLKQENYDFFIREILISDYANTVPASVRVSNDIFNSDFTTDADDGTRIYYASGAVTIDPTATIELPAGVDKAVVLINGDLTVQDNGDIEQVINVDDGDFLGFIVNGNITFEASVGFDKDMTNLVPVTDDTNVEGLFVADESLIVAGYDALSQPQLVDRKFIGAGTFVGFSGVSLNRDFENSVDPLTRSMNNLDPVSTFVYRPDLVKNLPRFMHTPGLIWQEVN